MSNQIDAKGEENESKVNDYEDSTSNASDNLDPKNLSNQITFYIYFKNISLWIYFTVDLFGLRESQLLTDNGDQIDPNLIQLLAREVLGEKINFMMNNYEIKSNQIPPQPSPRKSLEFVESHKDQFNFEFVLKTPIATPTQSPPRSPLPQPSHFKTEETTAVKEKENQEQPIQFYILNKSDDEYSILDVTIEEDNLLNNQNIDDIKGSGSVLVPPTPIETPRDTPSPQPDTPSESKSDQVLNKLLKSISIQCDPLVIPDPVPSIPAPQQESIRKSEPSVINLSEQQESKMPEPVKKQKKPDRLEIVSDDSKNLTESTEYSTSSNNTSTLLDSTTKSNYESDSYFSEGAWLLSKSEGQIIQFDQNGKNSNFKINCLIFWLNSFQFLDVVNLNLADALNSVKLNPRKPESSALKSKISLSSYNGTQSEGEVKLNSLSKDVVDLYTDGLSNKVNGGVNKIIRSGELGEVQSTSFGFNLPVSSLAVNKNDKSEGEADQVHKLSTHEIRQKSPSSKKQSKRKESKIVELTVSAKQPKVKNKIKIESIRKSILIQMLF